MLKLDFLFGSVDTYVFGALYECETWTISTMGKEMRRLEAFDSV